MLDVLENARLKAVEEKVSELEGTVFALNALIDALVEQINSMNKEQVPNG